MNIQSLIAGLIIMAALFYVGSILWKKVRSFSPKETGCASDCGCDSKQKAKL